MSCEISLAYDYIDEVKGLFEEYTKMLGVNLDFQHYDEEINSLPGKYIMPDGRLYLAYYNGNLAGCIGLRKFDKDTCEMKRLFVRSEFRGLKIGKLLSLKVINDAKKLGYKTMYLDTLSTLENAVYTYKNLGFKEIEPYYKNPLEDVLYFKLDL